MEASRVFLSLEGATLRQDQDEEREALRKAADQRGNPDWRCETARTSRQIPSTAPAFSRVKESPQL